MAMWEGFTEEDIKRVSAGEHLLEAQPQTPSTTRVAKRQANIAHHSGKKNVARSRMLQKSNQPLDLSMNSVKMPKEAFLSKTQEKEQEETRSNVEDKQLASEVSSDSGCGASSSAGSPSAASATSTPNTSPSHGSVCLRIKKGKCYEVVSAEKGNSSCPLDDFQSRQKLMEEQNRQRKELLAKALADRKRQTTAEARRLQQIQDELQKLDLLLSNDVSILRDQIEVASHEFMEAQKRYNKAEKEFLDAKLLLFEKLERKELLTEHLCTIIEQNEIRKARKLSELMDKLQLDPNIVEIRENECINVAGNVILSPLCALDEVSYSACNTLKPRNERGKSDKISVVEANADDNKPPVSNVTPSECNLINIKDIENLVDQHVDSSKTPESTGADSQK